MALITEIEQKVGLWTNAEDACKDAQTALDKALLKRAWFWLMPGGRNTGIRG